MRPTLISSNSFFKAGTSIEGWSLFFAVVKTGALCHYALLRETALPETLLFEELQLAAHALLTLQSLQPAN